MSLRKLNEHEAYNSKIGGDNAGNINENIENLFTPFRKDKKNILTFSAIRDSSSEFKSWAHESTHEKPGFNTTSHLIEIAQSLKTNSPERALLLFDHIQKFLREKIRREFLTETNNASLLYETLEKQLILLKEEIQNFSPDNGDSIYELGEDFLIRKSSGKIFSITGIGEEISREIYHETLNQRQIKNKKILLPNQFETAFGKNGDINEVVKNSQKREQAIQKIRNATNDSVKTALENSNILVAAGYLPVEAISRGYGDKIGAIMAISAQNNGYNVANLIEKEFSLKSIDPRKLESHQKHLAQDISQMGYPFSKELFGARYGADAGAVHPEAIQILDTGNVETYVLNPNDLSKMTVITNKNLDTLPKGIQNVSIKKCPFILEVQSETMERPGKAQIIENWLANNKISFDHTATSETSISYSFQDKKMTHEKYQELSNHLSQKHPEEKFTLKPHKNQTLLYFTGNDLNRPGVLHRVSTALKAANINANMISQGISQRNIIVSVDDELSKKAIQYAHHIGITLSDDDLDNMSVKEIREFCENPITELTV